MKQKKRKTSLIISDTTFRYNAKMMDYLYLFFISFWFGKLSSSGVRVCNFVCVYVALPKDHLSVKQYGVGTVWYYDGSLLGFPVQLVLTFWMVFSFFLLNLSVGHRCGQLSLKRIHTYMISNCWEIVKPLYHNENQINHCYFDIYCLCKINLFVSWKIDIFFLFHVW